MQGPDKGRTYDLPVVECIVGRQGDQVALTDPTVSRRHARIEPHDGIWSIEDLGSANGTYVNGVMVRRPQRLYQGDQIRVAGTLLVFGGPGPQPVSSALDIDEDGRLVDSAIMATIPSNEESVILPTPEAGRQAIGNLRQLYHIISTISSIFDVDLLLNRVLDHVFELLSPDRAYVLLIDESGRMTPEAVRYSDAAGDHEVPISLTIVNHVIGEQVGVLCSNAMSDRRFTKGQSVHEFGIRSALCVPIVGRERILGVLHVDSSVANNTYSTEQLRLLTAIGYQTGLAVENVLLYETAVASERLAAMGETVAALSHYIKNMLQALLAGTDAVGMALEGQKWRRACQSWPIVTRNLDRMNALILNMLAFSKDRQPLLQAINVNQVVADCVDFVTPQADERGVALLRDLGDVPPIPADTDGVHRALLNLLTNAIDAVPDKRGIVTVSTEFDTLRQEMLLKVADNGPGMDDQTRRRLFEPFYSTKGQKGTGLGLAVTHKIVSEHAGRIDVAGAPGQGTTFTIRLPAEPKPPAASDETYGPSGT